MTTTTTTTTKRNIFRTIGEIFNVSLFITFMGWI